MTVCQICRAKQRQESLPPAGFVLKKRKGRRLSSSASTCTSLTPLESVDVAKYSHSEQSIAIGDCSLVGGMLDPTHPDHCTIVL